MNLSITFNKGIDIISKLRKSFLCIEIRYINSFPEYFTNLFFYFFYFIPNVKFKVA